MSEPNVVLCVCDQLRAFDVGCYGHPLVRTPNLDRLASGGCRFSTAISNNPVCTPARSCMVSGQYSRTCNGMTGNVMDDPPAQRRHLPATSLAEAYRGAGYRTASIGKWHMASRPDVVGFDDWVYPTVYHRHRHRLYLDAARPDGFTVDDWTWEYDLSRVREFLDRRDDAPFFLYYNIEPPHMPVDDVPDRYRTMYAPDEAPIRPNACLDGELAYDDQWFRTYLWDHRFYRDREPHTETLPDGFDLRGLTAMYLGLVSLVDDLVGRLMEELSTRGLADDTIVLFTSDHGDNLGSHGDFNKATIWEEALRVPMIVTSPGRIVPRVADTQIATLIDVMPTLLGLSGIECPPAVQGRDLSPVVNGERQSLDPNVAFTETCRHGIAIRTPTHTYAMRLRDMSVAEHHPENDEVVDDGSAFYDLQADPYQFHNLAPTEANSPVARDLRERLLAWHHQTPWMQALLPGSRAVSRPA